MKNARVCLVGATGAVGNEFLRVLERRSFPMRSLVLLASSKSVGKEKEFRGRTLKVQDAENYDFREADIAFFTAGAGVSEQYVPRARDAGCLVIDNTSRYRMDDDKALVVPGINGNLLDAVRPGDVVPNPNCSTIQIVKVLRHLEELFGLSQVVVSTYQAASGAGRAAMEEMSERSVSRSEVRASSHFYESLAYNVVPQIDRILESGYTKEEQKVVQESRKILGLPRLDITATAVRVPVMVGHSVSMYTTCKRAVERDAFIARLSDDPELCAYPQFDEFPTPRFIDDPQVTYVGRIRHHEDNPKGVWTWVVADNLWVGAALNAVQIAERWLASQLLNVSNA